MTVGYGGYPALTPLEPILVEGSKISDLASAMACMPPSPGADAFEGLIRAVLPTIAWKERYLSRMPLQLKPSQNSTLRRCTRVVAMVHELHKVGYQRIRAIPQESPNGMHWRCHVTFASNVEPDGFTLKEFDIEDRGLVAHYVTGQGANYFGWKDAAKLSARELAVLFLERFPQIMQNGQGRDWLYAGWLTDFLGRMENADEMGLLTFEADYPLDPKPIDPWMPPPPRV